MVYIVVAEALKPCFITCEHASRRASAHGPWAFSLGPWPMVLSPWALGLGPWARPFFSHLHGLLTPVIFLPSFNDVFFNKKEK